MKPRDKKRSQLPSKCSGKDRVVVLVNDKVVKVLPHRSLLPEHPLDLISKRTWTPYYESL